MDISKKRPVPSKAALRILYQLAYISSGTLVGVAALCAEERRRRTQIVQKIADNAKRIRQSPRYNHNAAIAAGPLNADNANFFDSRRTSQRFDAVSLQHRGEEVASAPFLPTAVDDGYNHLTVRRHSKKKRPVIQAEALTGDESLTDEHHAFRSDIRARPAPVLARPVSSRMRRLRPTVTTPPGFQAAPSRKQGEDKRWSLSYDEDGGSQLLHDIDLHALPPISDSSDRVAEELESDTRASADPAGQTSEHELVHLWRRTRNITHVLDRAAILESSSIVCGDNTAKRELRAAKLEVLLGANRLDSAAQLVKEIHSDNISHPDCILLAAMLCARLADWNAALEFLDSAKQKAVLKFDGKCMARLNKLISYHASQEGCEETWKFVTELERRYGFTPNKQTTAIMLGAIVTDTKYELLSAWLSHVKHTGSPFTLHGMHAADLMTRYYHQHRPSAARVEALCRTLNKADPALAGDQYQNLIKRATAYEYTRRKSSRNAARVQAAEIRLTRLEAQFPYVHSRDRDSLPSNMVPGPDDEFVQVSRARSRVSLHADMLLALSQGQHVRVLEMYRDSLGTDGLPVSPSILEAAVQASLQLHRDDPLYAMGLLQDAWDKGFTRASGQCILAIHELQLLSKMATCHAQKIADKVQQYHQIMTRLQETPDVRVWHVAANILISHHQARHGLDLLKAYYSAYPESLKCISSSTLATFLNGFAATRYIRGIRWVAKTITERDIRVSDTFISAFKGIVKHWDGERSPYDATAGDSVPVRRFTSRALLQKWLEECTALRDRQESNAQSLGQRLVRQLVECVRQQSKPAIPSAARTELDETLFGPSAPTPALQTTDAPEPECQDMSRTAIPSADIEDLRGVLAKEIGLTRVMHKQRRAHGDLLWRLRYKRFYDRDILLADGAVAPFRYFCPDSGLSDQGKRFARQDDMGRWPNQERTRDMTPRINVSVTM